MNILTVLKTGSEYDIKHVEWLQRNIALDFGAHVGSWSRSMSPIFKEVYAFEPNKKTTIACKC